uniref:Mitochondrial 28s ribosomal protein s27 n=1 Tax=Rhabditophanes sp. KR3021 TaxID=114890 RepID=A0AC35THU1_9BILA
MLRKVFSTLPKSLSRRSLALSAQSRAILSKEFHLNQEWSERHNNMKKLALGGDYEWIAAVQKKFIGGGKASAVDVDAAACGAEEKDQIHDIVDLIYKLRHTDNAADFLSSTEYAVLRLLLKHNAVSEFFKILNDPINHGIFMNEHVACLALEYFIESKDFCSAAKIGTFVMQQEMFSSQLLNHLSVYSLLKWLELPKEERVMSEELHPKLEDFEEDDEALTFRYPYLKNKYFDNHFDIQDAPLLVGKSLIWLGEVISADDTLKSSLKLVGLCTNGDYEGVKELIEKNAVSQLNVSALNIANQLISDAQSSGGEATKDDPQVQLVDDIKKALGEIGEVQSKLSEQVFDEFKKIQSAEEKTLMQSQKQDFVSWNKKREELLSSQTEKLRLKLRLQEIQDIKKKLEDEKEVLFFFENRTQWEDQATEKKKLFEELKLNENNTKESEDSTTQMFENARKIIEHRADNCLIYIKTHSLMSSSTKAGILSNESISTIKLVSEKISGSLHLLNHDPSLALYRLQEHIHKTMPRIVERKQKMNKVSEQLVGACCDIDNSTQAVNSIIQTNHCLHTMKDTLKDCIYYSQQLEYEHTRRQEVVHSSANI